jgi:hypothetical protein
MITDQMVKMSLSETAGLKKSGKKPIIDTPSLFGEDHLKGFKSSDALQLNNRQMRPVFEESNAKHELGARLAED